MAKKLRSVGVDVGTTTTQLILSELTVENRASAFSVPQMDITGREVTYESPIFFTPLLEGDLVDAPAIRAIVEAEYQKAGVSRGNVDTGAIIITGETSRKENARAVLHALSEFAGDFVVATAGPDLESILAAKGAGADRFAESTGKPVLHMDIGGGTSNLAWFADGKLYKTGCMNVGGRLVKLDEDGIITYISPVLEDIFDGKVGEMADISKLEALAQTLADALEMAAGLRPRDELFTKLWTAEAGAPWDTFPKDAVLSFSGGVADCVEKELSPFAFGDLGPLLGRAMKKSRLCRGAYRLGEQTIRATVIGAGCHSATLSGSTVFYQNITFPLKNLPVVSHTQRLRQLDGPGVLALPGLENGNYEKIRALAVQLADSWPDQPVLIALQADMAKALGHALALRLGRTASILCLDRVYLEEGSYLDVGAPVACALPVVIKTLILNG